MVEPSLSEDDAPANPFALFSTWYDAARAAQLPEPDAMTLATTTSDGSPSARMVLLKEFDERGFVFYTNYNSEKGRVLSANPRAALVLFWAQLYRQIRVVGSVHKVTATESDAYFRSRPKGSRIAAVASDQSETLLNRSILDRHVDELTTRYAANQDVPRPEHWGGFRVVPDSLEFWQGRRDRLHDRLVYTRGGDDTWAITRLYP